MAADEFDKVELPAIEQLQSLGWEYVKGEDLSPEKSSERSSYKEFVLEKRLTFPREVIRALILQRICSRETTDFPQRSHPSAHLTKNLF